MMYYLRLKDDRHGRRWKVRQAVSVKAAVECIQHAMVTGSVGGKDTVTEYDPRVPFAMSARNTRVIADVVRVHPDNTEVQPS
jgi:hypothetical protein